MEWSLNNLPNFLQNSCWILNNDNWLDLVTIKYECATLINSLSEQKWGLFGQLLPAEKWLVLIYFNHSRDILERRTKLVLMTFFCLCVIWRRCTSNFMFRQENSCKNSCFFLFASHWLCCVYFSDQFHILLCTALKLRMQKVQFELTVPLAAWGVCVTSSLSQFSVFLSLCAVQQQTISVPHRIAWDHVGWPLNHPRGSGRHAPHEKVYF